MTHRLLFLVLFLLPSLAHGAMPMLIHWHDEATDTVKINTLLEKANSIESAHTQGRVAEIARMMVGIPYAAATLEKRSEGLVVNLDSMDCTTFVENVAALAMTAGENRSAWQDFVHNLTGLRYRQGEVDGYASRLHYICDWIIDNEHRGNLREVTDRFPSIGWEVKSIDFMTRNRDLYPALADSTEYDRMKRVESGYFSHRFPYVKSGQLNNKAVISQFQEGDIVALTCKRDGLDVSHMGIIVMEKGKPHLLHASQKAGKVIVDPLPLADYMRRARHLTGMRVIRLLDR